MKYDSTREFKEGRTKSRRTKKRQKKEQEIKLLQI
jgi:hypothetical protein